MNFIDCVVLFPEHDGDQAVSPSDADGSTSSSKKVARMTVLDDDTKEAILSMSKASEMEYEERKRQYAAMHLEPIVLFGKS